MGFLTRRGLLLGAGAVGVATAARAKIRHEQIGTPGDAVNFREYLFPTDTQASDAIDRCIAKLTVTGSHTGRYRSLYIPPGIYLDAPLIRTHKFPANVAIFSDGNPEETILYRTADYGSTFQFGDNNATTTGGSKVPAGLVRVSGVTLQHGPAYIPGDIALTNRATSGSHLEINGAQGGVVEDCYLLRLKNQILFNGGPGGIYVQRVKTIGVWDHLYAACQETVSSIKMQYDSQWGNPAGIYLDGVYCQGQKSAPRSVTWSDSGGHSRTVTDVENIGPQHNVLVNSCETLNILAGYYGCANVNNISLIPLATAGSLVRNITIGGGVFFDSARNAEVGAQAPSKTYAVDNFVMGNFTMNGEAEGLIGVSILPTLDGNDCSVFNGAIGNFVIEHHVGSGMVLTGLDGTVIGPGRITDYNCLNIPSTSDAQRNAAIYVNNKSLNLTIAGITAGGGGNFDEPTAAGGNYSQQGVVVDASVAGTVTLANNTFSAPT